LLRNQEIENPKQRAYGLSTAPIGYSFEIPSSRRTGGKWKRVLDLHGAGDRHNDSCVGLDQLCKHGDRQVQLQVKEVGIRRLIGSTKSSLALQFIVEYFCITILAAAIAGVLFVSILPHFTYLTGIPLDTPEFFTHRIWIAGGWLFLVGTIIAGIYPALFLLRINPIAALKGKFSGTKRGVLTRQSLIIIQFTSSMVLVAFLLVIDSQLDYMRLTNKKIDIENVITVRNPFVYANDDDSVQFR